MVVVDVEARQQACGHVFQAESPFTLDTRAVDARSAQLTVPHERFDGPSPVVVTYEETASSGNRRSIHNDVAGHRGNAARRVFDEFNRRTASIEGIVDEGVPCWLVIY